MWDIDVLNLLYKAKKKKINILQIGFMSNTESLWICKNIIEKNNSSKLYIYDFWNQYKEKEDIITLPILQDTFFFNKSKDDFYDGLEKYNKKNIVLFTKNKEQLKKELKKDNLHFDYILINRTYLNNISDYLLLLWAYLKNDGNILINKLGKNEEDLLIIESFIKVYENDIKLKEFSDILIIEKNIEKIKIPKNIEKTLDEYLKLEHFDEVLEIPHYKGKIEWDIQTSDKEKELSFFKKYKKFIKKYYDCMIIAKNGRFKNFTKLDLFRFIFKKMKDLPDLKHNVMTKITNFKKESYLDDKIDILKNILNDTTDYRHNYFYSLFKNHLKKDKLNFFLLSFNGKKSEWFKYNKYLIKKGLLPKKTKFNISCNFNKEYEILNCLKLDKNILNFDSIIKFINLIEKKKIKFDLIVIPFTTFVMENSNINYFSSYVNYIFVNILYFIFSTQNLERSLLFNFSTIKSNIEFQLIEIISKYYKQVKILKLPYYNNNLQSCIIANNFKGISQNELKDLYNIYIDIYNLNIKKNVNKIWNGENIKVPYINNLFVSNNNKLLLKIDNYFIKYFSILKKDIIYKSNIYKYLNNKKISEKNKKYILNKILKKQFDKYFEQKKKIIIY